MRLPLALLLGLCACQSGLAVAPQQFDGGDISDQAGPDGGSLDGPKINLARACAGFTAPSPVARLCRSDGDCQSQNERCRGPSDSWSSGGCGVGPPRSDCKRDLDCKVGEQCLIQKVDCYEIPRCMPSSCAQTGCSRDERCRPDGRCEIVPCAEGWDCGEARTCSAAPVAGARDAHGCVPRLCTEGYTCPSGAVCEGSGPAVDAWGCRWLTCAERGGAACPQWQRCEMMTSGTKTVGTCKFIACHGDTDCPCGACVKGFCEPGPGVCEFTERVP